MRGWTRLTYCKAGVLQDQAWELLIIVLILKITLETLQHTSKYLTENPSQIPQVYPIGCVLEDAQDKAGFLAIHLDACQLGN